MTPGISFLAYHTALIAQRYIGKGSMSRVRVRCGEREFTVSDPSWGRNNAEPMLVDLPDVALCVSERKQIERIIKDTLADLGVPIYET